MKTVLAVLVGVSPAALDKLNELTAALGNDPNFTSTMTNAYAGKPLLDSTLTALSGKSVADILQYLCIAELAKTPCFLVSKGLMLMVGMRFTVLDLSVSAVDGLHPSR